ncbi:FAD-binding oxidoreductase [Panacagrimonas sp.]|uniref:FAD-binding oxidoreductase n=1 Tax=Panacagrimonas sp. TaxID=2480088 RepID=UPI003B51F16A
MNRPKDTADSLDRARAAIAALSAHWPAGRLLTDPADCLAYGYDNSRRVVAPQAVVFALDEDEVVRVVEACRDRRVPLTVRGRGTNTTGASVPVDGGIVLSMERMNRILRLSPGDRLIECEAGCLNGDVQRAAAAHGLFWAPDPTSADYSTVGGNLACGAGGPRAVKYGTARENVLGLSAVTGAGQRLRCGSLTTKGVVGYDLTRLLIGSEGTLALITRAALKLLPRPPHKRTLRAAYSDVASAIAAVTRIMGQPATPCALEFFDGDAVALAQAWRDCGIPERTGALLLIDIDGDGDGLEADTAAVAAAAGTTGLLELRQAATAAESEDLWAARKALSPSLRKLAPRKVNEDVVVPVTQLPTLVAGLRKLSTDHGLRVVSFGHAGNGNLHVNLLADPLDSAQSRAIEACLHALFELVLSLGGSLSGEHGVGIEKRAYVNWEIDAPSLALMRAIKVVFDPAGILNPGKTLPDASEGSDTAPSRTSREPGFKHPV